LQPTYVRSLVIDDDKNALELMYRDSLAGEPIYRPSQFWQVYEDRHYAGLMQHSLRDLGTIGDSIGGGFNAEEPFPKFFDWGGSALYSANKDNPAFKGFVQTLNDMIKNNPDDPFLPYELSINALRRGATRYCEYYGATRGAKRLADVIWPVVGHPGDLFDYNGKGYTYQALYFYTKYAFAAKHVDFDAIDTIVELGAGSGRQAALILSLHPHITYLMFDIPTTLYFCQQYLRAVFPDRVVGYDRTRSMTALDALEPGKIYHFGAWQFPLLRVFRSPLFWNCQSLQEMDAEAVANYTAIVEAFTDNVLLVHSIPGIGVGAPGTMSLRAPGARAADYGSRFLPSFAVVESERAYNVLGDDVGGGGIQDMFLKRR
jgi:putative sugar O-methyltransferase